MDLITSRRFVLPATAEDWAGAYHFNLWSKRHWPYVELHEEDRLFWYESPFQRFSWETEAVRVERFEYSSLDEAVAIMQRAFGPLDESQPYLDDKPEMGYGLVYASRPIRRLDRARPEGFRMPMLGWLRLDPTMRGVMGF